MKIDRTLQLEELPMSTHTEFAVAQERSFLRQTDLMRWDNEGGAGPGCLRAPSGSFPQRHAAAQIRSLVRRAVRFRGLGPGLAVRSQADDAS